jgi:ABC-type polysaccharide/polyol phosphate export permease
LNTKVQNIIRFAKKLLNLNPTTQKIEALRQDIATTNPMADREWFYRMLDGL